MYADGVGWLATYDNYYDRFFSHGVIYFLRDSYFRELQTLLDEGATSKQVRGLVQRIQRLQHRIAQFEEAPHLFLTHTDKEPHDHPSLPPHVRGPDPPALAGLERPRRGGARELVAVADGGAQQAPGATQAAGAAAADRGDEEPLRDAL